MSLEDKSIAGLRVNYALKKFHEEDVQSDPFKQFSIWLSEAIDSKTNEPNAMTLASVKPDGKPAARVVLLKDLNKDGFVFFTNYESNKGKELEHNSNVAAVFCWLELQRQVRIEGVVVKISESDSDEYFHSRPHGSKIGAHASPQSRVIESREVLENKFSEIEKLFHEKPIMRPKHWGGYLIIPTSIEFWQGRQSRLHDRFIFTKQHDKSWKIERLAP
jgi:pyridoxamine 5'-phosphate oxidase